MAQLFHGRRRARRRSRMRMPRPDSQRNATRRRPTIPSSEPPATCRPSRREAIDRTQRALRAVPTRRHALREPHASRFLTRALTAAEALWLAASGTFPEARTRRRRGGRPAQSSNGILMVTMALFALDRYPSVAALKACVLASCVAARIPSTLVRNGRGHRARRRSRDAAYIIVEGRCEIRKETPNGTQTLERIGPGYFRRNGDPHRRPPDGDGRCHRQRRPCLSSPHKSSNRKWRRSSHGWRRC